MLLRQQHGLGRRRPAVDPDKAFHHLARLKAHRSELLRAVLFLERRQLFVVLRQLPFAGLQGAGRPCFERALDRSVWTGFGRPSISVIR